MDMNLLIVPADMPISQAIAVIDQGGRGIAFVCESNKLFGTLTDGDIRRHIMQNGNLELPVKKIANQNCRYAQKTQMRFLCELLEQYHVSSLPVIGEDGELLSIYFSDGLTALPHRELDVPVVIMAGGKGTRLYPYTKVLPKPLIPIGDKTITELIMDSFLECGCSQFTMIVNHKKNMIKAYFADESLKYRVRFVDEECPLGTGGGLKLLSGLFDHPFFMTNCDIRIYEDYEKIYEYHKTGGYLLTMVCAEKKITVPYGTVEVDREGLAKSISEKPSFSFLTNTGFYVIEPAFLRIIPDNQFIHITDLIQRSMEDGQRIGVYPIDGDQWCDMGQLNEMEKMRSREGV